MGILQWKTLQNLNTVLLILCALMVCFIENPVKSDDSQRMVTFAQLEEAALLNSPAIQAYEQKINALNGYWVQAGLGPNPEVSYIGDEISSANAGGKHGIEVSQEFLGGHQLAFEQQAVARQIETARHEMEMVRQRVLTDVRVATYQYLAAQNKLLHLCEILKNDRAMVEKIQQSYKNGNASRLDFVNSRIAARKSEQQYIEAQNELQAAWGRLACIIGLPDSKPQLVRADLSQTREQKTWEYYVQTLLNSSPEVLRAQARIVEAQKKVCSENARNSQNFTLSGGVLYNVQDHAMEGSVGVSIPLRIRDRNQGNISAACSEVIQAQKELERVKLNLQHRLADVYKEYATACENLAIYRDSLLPEATEALELAQIAYQNQETSMLDLITAQKNYRETNIEYYDALCKYWTTLTLLEGKLLEGSLEDSSM